MVELADANVGYQKPKAATASDLVSAFHHPPECNRKGLGQPRGWTNCAYPKPQLFSMMKSWVINLVIVKLAMVDLVLAISWLTV